MEVNLNSEKKGKKKNKPQTITLAQWHLTTAQVLRSMELEFTRDEIIDNLYKVWEELGYIPDDIDVDQGTRQGYCILNKLLFAILRTQDPDQEVSIKIAV